MMTITPTENWILDCLAFQTYGHARFSLLTNWEFILCIVAVYIIVSRQIAAVGQLEA